MGICDVLDLLEASNLIAEAIHAPAKPEVPEEMYEDRK